MIIMSLVFAQNFTLTQVGMSVPAQSGAERFGVRATFASLVKIVITFCVFTESVASAPDVQNLHHSIITMTMIAMNTFAHTESGTTAALHVAMMMTMTVTMTMMMVTEM